MENSNRYVPVREFAELNCKEERWPSTPSTIWALKAGSPENGFGAAFIKVGRRVLVDVDAFWECVSNNNKVHNDMRYAYERASLNSVAYWSNEGLKEIPKNMPKRRFALEMENWLYERLQLVAQTRSLTMGELIRTILKEHSRNPLIT